MTTSTKPMTMQERIEAFYLQSGGPNNHQIKKILDKHLLEGKDHGVRGKKETFEDAFRHAFLEDKSLSSIMQFFMKRKMLEMTNQMEDKERKKQFSKNINQITESFVSLQQQRIQTLENEVKSLRDAVEQLTTLLTSKVQL